MTVSASGKKEEEYYALQQEFKKAGSNTSVFQKTKIWICFSDI